MEGKRRPKPRTLHRVYSRSRLEEQLWALAYQQLGPCRRRPAELRPRSARERPPAAVPRSSASAQGA